MPNRVYTVTATFVVCADDEIAAKTAFWDQIEIKNLLPVAEQPKVVLRGHLEAGVEHYCKGDTCEFCELDSKKDYEED